VRKGKENTTEQKERKRERESVFIVSSEAAASMKAEATNGEGKE
jgi:hypothetical protein